ncbi:hypothetical protein KL942_000426 [Ogataea angusta]|uniref:BZIP domain-containing protein n=1 Tax=Pichia angusta TaxID=870730 RepID=A0ABQ7S3D4_PICAN|nr:hypothetical protein KL920_000428 [Ogataea angusta]KAG7843330.1 hypothetical protein KL942_000426 [Ogataea angusta]KAG7852517.1 hypothetical protein KL940_000218 [Ogataea angusta]
MNVDSGTSQYWSQYPLSDNIEAHGSFPAPLLRGSTDQTEYKSPQVLDRQILQQQQFQNNGTHHGYVSPLTEKHNATFADSCDKAEEAVRKDVGDGLWQEVFPGTTKKSKRLGSSASSESSNTHKPLSEEALLAEKRKAQNRAAQRAFRERKEIKLKELSAKLSQSEGERQRLLQEIEQLKQKNTLLGIENEMLQKMETPALPKSHSSTRGHYDFPQTREDFIKSVVDVRTSAPEAPAAGIPHSMVDGVPYSIEAYNHNNEKVLTVAAVWDYLNDIASEKDINLDIPGIISQLRGAEVCHGHGPAYPVSVVNAVVEKNTEFLI